MFSSTVCRSFRQTIRKSRLATPQSLHLRPSLLRQPSLASPKIAPFLKRQLSSSPFLDQRPLTDKDDNSQTVAQESEEIAARKAQEPAYEMTFTCRRCVHRSTHRITKQAYHFGTTLITCPGCKNRHLISDNLQIFSDKNLTLEDILKEKGQLITKGVLGEEGDVEFVDQSRLPDEMQPGYQGDPNSRPALGTVRKMTNGQS